MREECFFFWRFIAIFLLLKNPGYQYKGGFSFKITKIRQQFFSGAGWELRVSSHLCLLGAILRVP
jgi:hypothetical protein